MKPMPNEHSSRIKRLLSGRSSASMSNSLMPLSNDKSTFLIGLSVSIALHSALFGYYFWQPETPPAKTTAAAPIPVTLVMPIASPQKKHQTQIEPEQEQQPDLQKSQPKPKPKAEPDPEVKAPEAKKDTPFETAKPKPKVEEKPKEPEAEPVEEIVKASSIDSIKQEAKPEQAVDIETPEKQIAAPQLGATNPIAEQRKVSWRTYLNAHLEQYKKYPRHAKRLRREGIPWVRFKLDRKGYVQHVELVTSSGVSSLDKEALALPKRAEPLPPPPKEVVGDLLSLTVPIVFSLR
ncbi:energy transducer TonB [Parashewanella tropica]|uniref:energy transducer TonB n=1 Tax=Parashewanella tropica TaxID=2547970 RepID=UPI00105A972D|nr:energy transducer TonB [Parashewanella tropica]